MIRPTHPSHLDCWACGHNADGLHLRFFATADGLQAEFDCHHRYAGYANTMHGGVVASLLDSAMTNCLFERKIVALTAELTVRYRHRVICDRPAVVRAWVDECRNDLWLLKSELRQNGQVKARAEGKFLRAKPDLSDAGSTEDQHECRCN